MRRLFIPLIASLGFICTPPEAYSDARSYDGASTQSQVSIAAAIEVPKPFVEGVVNGELDLSLLGAADATVEVAYPDISDGHTVGLRWKSNIQQHDLRQTVSGGAKKLIFKIPNNVVAADLGMAVRLTASVGIADNPLVISAPEDITVVNGAPPGEFPRPTLPDVNGNQVDVGAFAGDLKVNVHYPSIDQGHIVQVVWEGVTPYKTPLKVAADNSPLEFIIPHDTVMANLGKPVSLSYEASFNGQLPERSEPAPVTVSLLTIPTTPVVPDAVAGQLDLKALRGRTTKVTFTYPGITVGHTVGMRWAGDPPYNTPHPAIGATPRPLEFTIPYEQVRLNKGKQVNVSGSVGTGAKLIISPELPIEIIDTRPTGDQTAAGLNARYNDTRPVCDDNKPAYHCSGVTLRATLNGDYDPWNPSPSGQRIGGVSFSYKRKDTYITDLLYSSGFLLLDQDDALAENKALTYLCIYAYDSWTLHGNVDKGCGFKPKAVDLSSCASVGVRTAAQWYAYTERLTHQMYQCSLSTSDPDQFYTSIQVRARPPALPSPVAYGYNELMMAVWPQNIGEQLPIEAFFYKANTPGGNPAAALAEARVYQTKYWQRTLLWRPVIKIDFAQVAASPFSYNTADQAIAQ